MKLRHELKYITTPAYASALISALTVLMRRDPHGNVDGCYQTTSLYFDTIDGAAFFDKLDGTEFRRKYRIRAYNTNRQYFKLECKYKLRDWTAKESENIDPQLVRELMLGRTNLSSLSSSGTLTQRFIRDVNLMHLRPSVIIQYQRTALINEELNVRITVDEQIRTGGTCTDLFNPDLPLIPVMSDGSVVVELKYLDVLPLALALLLRPMKMQRLAVSKYALGYNKK